MERGQIARTVRKLSYYNFGESASALFAVEDSVNESYGDEGARLWIERELAGVLVTEASLAAKQKASYAIGRRPSLRTDVVLWAAIRRVPEAHRPPIEHLPEDPPKFGVGGLLLAQRLAQHHLLVARISDNWSHAERCELYRRRLESRSR